MNAAGRLIDPAERLRLSTSGWQDEICGQGKSMSVLKACGVCCVSACVCVCLRVCGTTERLAALLPVCLRSGFDAVLSVTAAGVTCVKLSKPKLYLGVEFAFGYLTHF